MLLVVLVTINALCGNNCFMQMILSKRRFSASNVRFVWTENCFLKADHLLCWILLTPSITQMFTFPYNLRSDDVRYAISKQIGKKAFLMKWASEKVLSVTFAFELPFSAPWFLKRFGLEIVQFFPLLFSAAPTLRNHGYFFSVTTVWLTELVFLINP